MLKDGKAAGIVPDVVLATAERVGHSGEANFTLPILRSLEMAKEQPNTFVYLTATPDHQPDYTMVFCFLKDRMGGVWKKTRSWKSFDTMPKTSIFGFILGSPAPELLATMGFSNFSPVRMSVQNVEKLIADRIDVWMAYSSAQHYFLQQFGQKSEDFVFSRPLVTTDVCLATSKATSPEVVAKWRNAFKSIVADGTYNAIRQRYLSYFPWSENPLPDQ